MAHQQLTDRERYQIEALKEEGYTPTRIVVVLGRSPSTICRELARNLIQRVIRQVWQSRGQISEGVKLDGAMRRMIRNLLADYLSPEQISGGWNRV